jgi:hypothetical protein
MKYAVEMGSDVVIWIPSSITTGTVDGGIHRHTEAAWRSQKPIFVQSKEIRLKQKSCNKKNKAVPVLN